MPSTVIASYNYDEVKQILRIKFISGLVYEYKNVPSEVYIEMKKTTSKGSFLNKHIKNNYEFVKVEEEN